MCKTSCFGSQGTWQPRLQPLAAPCSTPEPFPRGSSTPRRSPSQVRRAVLLFCRRHLAGSRAASFPDLVPFAEFLLGLLTSIIASSPSSCLVIPALGSGGWRGLQELTLQNGLPSPRAAPGPGGTRPCCLRAICRAESGSAPRAWLQPCGKPEPFVVLGLNAVAKVLEKCCPRHEGTGASCHKQVRIRAGSAPLPCDTASCRLRRPPLLGSKETSAGAVVVSV